MAIHRGYVYTEYGQLHYAEAGSGPVILMLHQAPRSHDEFAELQPLLANGFHTIAMDMLGFGSSAHLPAPQTIETMAAGGWALLDALEVGSVVVLGHHTGAVVAQEMAVQAPERTNALVLSAMPWVDAERRSSGDVVNVDLAKISPDGAHLTELWSLRQPYYPVDRPDLLNRFVRDALAPGVDPAEGHRAVNRYAMDERIGVVTAPVLLLAPTADPFVAPHLPAVTRALSGAANVHVQPLAGAQIPAMEQCADEVAQHVREFLAGLD